MKKPRNLLIGLLALIATYSAALYCLYIPDKQYHGSVEAGKTRNCDKDRTPDSLILKKEEHLNTYGWDRGRFDGKEVVGKKDVDACFDQSWLEVADDGFLWDNEHLAAIKEWIGLRHAENRPVLLVIYVHGWNNNADDSLPEQQVAKFPNYVARFVDTTQRLAETEKIPKAPAVLGIWVGWHGLDFQDNFFGKLAYPISFPSRANKAAQIGDQKGVGVRKTPSLRLAFDQIAAASVTKPEYKNDRMLIIGHSFGGRILVHTFAQGGNGPLASLYGPNALITTVNAAVDGKCVDPIMKAGAKIKTKWPTWINVVSSDDVVRHDLYKWGSIITMPMDECGREFLSLDRAALGFRKGEKADYVFKSYSYTPKQHVEPKDQFSDFVPLVDTVSPISTPYCAYDKTAAFPPKSDCRFAEVYKTKFEDPEKSGASAITIRMNKNFICQYKSDAEGETCEGKIGFHSAAFQTGLARLYLATLYGHPAP